MARRVFRGIGVAVLLGLLALPAGARGHRPGRTGACPTRPACECRGPVSVLDLRAGPGTVDPGTLGAPVVPASVQDLLEGTAPATGAPAATIPAPSPATTQEPPTRDRSLAITGPTLTSGSLSLP